jgi:O-acetyl-ADP-ribose deacetylase (regulator of RNase III)
MSRNCWLAVIEAVSRWRQHHLKFLAFPSISTGAYVYPLEKASGIALREIHLAIKQYPELEKIVVACFNQKTLEVYQKTESGSSGV